MKIGMASIFMHLFLFFDTTLWAKSSSTLTLVGFIPYAVSVQIGRQYHEGYLVQSNLPVKITTNYSNRRQRILTITAN